MGFGNSRTDRLNSNRTIMKKKASLKTNAPFAAKRFIPINVMVVRIGRILYVLTFLAGT